MDYVCDSCGEETASCLTLCPKCFNNQNKEIRFLNKLKERLNEYHCGYHEQLNKLIDNRLNQLKKGVVK